MNFTVDVSEAFYEVVDVLANQTKCVLKLLMNYTKKPELINKEAGFETEAKKLCTEKWFRFAAI